MIVDPYGMQVVEWTDVMAPNLNVYGIVPRLDDPERWREWAVAVCALPQIKARNPPDPEAFGNWADWAMRFCELPLR